ncbi:ATP-binding cassette domain-containing protein [Muribacter muris]|uniref:ATP-binding cassette domain-containing protein n=1 Tax=Muribacter muris TaxID=67855 RepID=A0A4Y9JTE1_9PAST|nr:ATP-binding cassette domain-containing protein [Muribacter muris]MBF0785664.1 ATP-binding cassette domain-containing protein [Muribacter muris]MBF0828335.1 ATP-binding cassette domain-containing protein [Muribacter muris]TFV08838.1 ATP-binding cassette domain-containing protein [Muribacter muris]
MIKISQVCHHIGCHQILDHIDLTIQDGGITALIGANGAGKSTLLSLIARLQPLQQGTIHLNELDIHRTPSCTIAKHLAILTQDNTIHSRITVRDLLMFGRYPHHQGKIGDNDRTIVQQALERFDLTPFADRFLAELSGGQRQRAFIAMIFCQQTQYILLDEPLNNLDMFHARALMQLLRQLTDELNLTTIMVVHDINIAAAYADNIVAMQQGRIAKIGSPAEMITRENLQQIFNLDAEVLTHQGKPLVVHHL